MVYNDAGYDVNSRLWIAIEALRGAPMEFIDTSKEGIKTEIKTDKYGYIYQLSLIHLLIRCFLQIMETLLFLCLI